MPLQAIFSLQSFLALATLPLQSLDLHQPASAAPAGFLSFLGVLASFAIAPVAAISPATTREPKSLVFTKSLLKKMQRSYLTSPIQTPPWNLNGLSQSAES